MKTENIKNVINNLIKGDERAILISGVWGIGKTYAIEEYIKSKKKDIKEKKIKIAYSSLFGKNSLDEVNTELYQLFHPAKKVLQVITNVAKLVNVGAGLSCGLNLNLDNDSINFNNKLRASEKIKSLIILDDFERKSDKISSEDMLGFINGLLNQGFKVVVLADLDTEFGKTIKKYKILKVEKNEEIVENVVSKINLSEDMLGFYKEKVFDRIYKITETPEDVIKNIFGEDFKYVTTTLQKEFENNIRFSIKANSLFKQITNYLKEKKYETTKFDVIMKACVYAVIELMTNRYSKIFEEQVNNSDYLKYSERKFENFITNYDKSLKNEYSVLSAVNAIYINEDYSIIDSIFNPEDGIDVSKSCFYFSDDNKKKVINEQYNFILSIKDGTEFSHSNVNQYLRDWFTYAYYIDLSFIDKSKLFEKLNSLHFRIDGFGEESQTFINFIDEYNNYCSEQIKHEIVSLLQFDNLEKLNEGLYNISRRYEELDDGSQEYISNHLKDNGFFLQKINGDMSYDEWHINHLICQIVSQTIPSLKEDLVKVMNDIRVANINDKSCDYRINSLISQYNLK